RDLAHAPANVFERKAERQPIARVAQVEIVAKPEHVGRDGKALDGAASFAQHRVQPARVAGFGPAFVEANAPGQRAQEGRSVEDHTVASTVCVRTAAEKVDEPGLAGAGDGGAASDGGRGLFQPLGVLPVVVIEPGDDVTVSGGERQIALAWN